MEMTADRPWQEEVNNILKNLLTQDLNSITIVKLSRLLTIHYNCDKAQKDVYDLQQETCD